LLNNPEYQKIIHLSGSVLTYLFVYIIELSKLKFLKLVMKKVVKRPVVVSTVSTAVALGVGVAAMFVGRRVKQEKPISLSNHQKVEKSISKTFAKEIYGDDNDLGYC